jgi:hypothetical protein
MTYEAWRISFQSSEQAARSAYTEVARLRRLLDEVQQNLERDVAAMPMFPITAENAEAAQDAMTGVCFTLGVLRVRDNELVRAGEQGANNYSPNR